MNTLVNQHHQFTYSDCLCNIKKLTVNLKSLCFQFKRFCIQNTVVIIEAPLSDVAVCSGADKFGPNLAFSNIDIYARRVSVPAICQHYSINN